jgi:hypothetical protein
MEPMPNSMSTSGPEEALEPEILAQIPARLRSELLKAYQAILRNFRERRWEPSELNGGKLCEVVHSILRGYVDGVYPEKATKPRDMVAACRSFESADASFPRSVRIQIPRMLMALYEIRNGRGVGHVGGDVNPNHMDANCVLAVSKWLMGELVRLFHNLSVDDAARIVDVLADLPLVWSVGGNLRVLDPAMQAKDKSLVLLYQSAVPVKEKDLVRWVEHTNITVFRRDILKAAHKEKLLEYDALAKTAEISPRGVQYVEVTILGASETGVAFGSGRHV